MTDEPFNGGFNPRGGTTVVVKYPGGKYASYPAILNPDTEAREVEPFVPDLTAEPIEIWDRPTEDE